MPRMSRRLVKLVCTLLLVVPGLPVRAGGGVVMTGQGCTMHIDFYSARFTAYQPDTRGNEEFCEDLPDTGPTVFVLDYLHASLKLVPVNFRIIRNTTGQGRFAKWEDVAALGDLEPLTLYYHPPVIQPDASFQAEYDFADEGKYIGIVTAGHPTNDQTYRAVFPFEVGRRSHWGPALGVLLIVAAAALLWRRHRGRPRGPTA
jgi:hypothetical protein